MFAYMTFLKLARIYIYTILPNCNNNNGQRNLAKAVATLTYIQESQRAKLKYLRATITSQYLITEEMESNSEILLPCLLSKDAYIKIYEIIILPVVLYACQPLFLALRE
jgi:hypothetical protein